ncbi:MAG: sensor histidine kinase [Hyphomicrobium sp.]
MPQTRSPDAQLEANSRDAEALLDVASLIERFGLFGLIWFDRNLIVRRTFGRMVDFVKVGAPAADSLPLLIGLEAELVALSSDSPRTLEIPAVSIPTADGGAEKLNFTFLWSPQQSAVIALAHRSETQTALEVELSRQIRARLMAEAESNAKSRELQRANADLENYAGIISHDLQAPLRHMRYLTSNARDAPATSGVASHEALDLIAAQAERMSNMLQRLFEYSNIGRKYEALEIVDCGELVRGVIRSLPGSGFAVEIGGDWPTLLTLRAPLDLAMRNLIANARQHHDLSTGVIHVACADSQDAIVITVADDGPGIAPEHHAAIFLPFRTLNAAAETGATGMGLALVNRAVESVGGAVTLASNPAKARGTIFAVQWPKVIDAC